MWSGYGRVVFRGDVGKRELNAFWFRGVASSQGLMNVHVWTSTTQSRIASVPRDRQRRQARRLGRSAPRSGPQRLTAGGPMAGGLVAYIRRTVSREMHAAGSPLRLRTGTALPAPVTGM